MTAEILNAERLLKKLRTIPEAFKARIRHAMAEQADEIVGMMNRLAPAHVKPSIGWRWGSRAPAGSLSVGQVRAPSAAASAGLVITIYASEWTARWFEFGTADRFHKSGKFVGKIDAMPFFFPSWRAGRKGARRKVQAALRQAARDVARQG